jgi:hypothetical protein
MDDRTTGGELRGTCEYATRQQLCEHLVKQLSEHLVKQLCEHLVKQLCEHLVKQLPIRGAILLCADEESRCAHKFDKLNTNTDGLSVSLALSLSLSLSLSCTPCGSQCLPVC